MSNMKEEIRFSAFSEEVNYWKSRALYYQKKYEDRGCSCNLGGRYEQIKGENAALKARDSAMRAEYHSRISRMSLEIAELRRNSVEQGATIEMLQQRITELEAIAANAEQQLGLVSPPRSISSDSTYSPSTTCNCPNCAPHLYTPSSAGTSRLDSGLDNSTVSCAATPRIVCKACCYRMKVKNCEMVNH